MTTTPGCAILCVLVLAVVGLQNVASQMEDNAVEMLVPVLRRRLLDGDSSAVTALDDKMFAFLTKYEENFNYTSITSNPKAYALYGWQKDEKSIKYAIVASDSPSEALTASSGADISNIHIHVKGKRGTNSTDILALKFNNGTWPIKEEVKIYAAGTITDATVAAWTNTAGLKTAKALWDVILAGETYTNIHTTKNPDGEARGQNDWDYESLETVEDLIDEDVRKNSSNWRMAFLTPYEQTTMVQGDKTARGMGIFAWDGKQVLYHVLAGLKASDKLSASSYSDITGAHIHVGAMRGQDSANIIALTIPTGTDFKTTKGLKVYAEGQVTDADIMKYTSNTNNTKMPVASVSALWDVIKAGKAYVNVHTTLNKAGEIRGQIDWDYEIIDLAKEAIPAVNKTAAGKSGAAGFSASSSSLVSVTLALLMVMVVL